MGMQLGAVSLFLKAGRTQRRAQDVQEVEMTVFGCGGFVPVGV